MKYLNPKFNTNSQVHCRNKEKIFIAIYGRLGKS
jgi:hypothetical protein